MAEWQTPSTSCFTSHHLLPCDTTVNTASLNTSRAQRPHISIRDSAHSKGPAHTFTSVPHVTAGPTMHGTAPRLPLQAAMVVKNTGDTQSPNLLLLCYLVAVCCNGILINNTASTCRDINESWWGSFSINNLGIIRTASYIISTLPLSSK